MTTFNKNYFPLELSFYEDKKIVKLERALPFIGSAIYLKIIILLYKNENIIEDDIEEIAYLIRGEDNIEDINKVLYDYNLFTVKDGFISCDAVEKRLEEIRKRTKRYSEMGKKSSRKLTTVKPTLNTSSTQVEHQTKLKETKLKETKEKNIEGNHTHLSISELEYDKFVKTYGKSNTDDYISRILNFVGNKKYKSLSMTLRNWLKKDGVTAVVDKNDCFRWQSNGVWRTLPPEAVLEFEQELQLAGTNGLYKLTTPKDYGLSNN